MESDEPERAGKGPERLPTGDRDEAGRMLPGNSIGAESRYEPGHNRPGPGRPPSIRRRLIERLSEKTGDPKRLDAIVDKLISKAETGSLKHTKEIRELLDGKTPQVVVPVDPTEIGDLSEIDFGTLIEGIRMAQAVRAEEPEPETDEQRGDPE